MRTLQIFLFLGLSAAVVFLGTHIAMAEIRNESLKDPSLTFSVRTEDGSVTLPDISFGDSGSGGEEAQATCMMTPGGTMPNQLLEIPVTPLAIADRAPRGNDPGYLPVSWSPSQSTPYNTPYYPNNPPPNNPPPDDPPPNDPPPVVVIPEPATLLIVGLGIGSAVVVRRWRRV